MSIYERMAHMDQKAHNKNHREATKLALWAVALVLWCSFIFSMSADTGTQSQGLSNALAQWVASVVQPGFNEASPANQTLMLQAYTFPIRKLAHFSEYALLGLIALGSCLQGRKVLRECIMDGSPLLPKDGSLLRPALTAAAFSLMYAATDEFHQLFVDGRSGQPLDVCIDFAGAAMAITVACFVVSRRK